MTRILSFLLLLILSATTSVAQRCRVFGVVRDQDGAPIELANVRIPGTAIGTSCDLQGRYSLTFESRDTIVVQYSMIGYETRKRTLNHPRDSIRIDIMLPSYGTMLGEASVTGTGVQTGTTQKIKPVDTHLAPSTTGNGVEEIIATQAGVSTHNELSSQYNVRGGSFDENCVYLNGVEVYRPMLVRSGQQEGLSVINPDMVESIAFSSGGFEARYGDKMSSVLDITYKRPTRLEASVSASLLGAGVYAGWGNKKLSAMTSVRYKTTSYLLGSLDTNGEYRPNFLDYQLVLQFHPSERWSMDLMGNISNNKYEFCPKERDTKFGRAGKGPVSHALRQCYADAPLQSADVRCPAILHIHYARTRDVRHSGGILAARCGNAGGDGRGNVYGTRAESARCTRVRRGTAIQNPTGATHAAGRTGLAQRGNQRKLIGMGNARFHGLLFATHAERTATHLQSAL